mmetsp:Transcript_9299/g.23080  ORF Transcript_9299/g.23080 Transcript_9299/m.23080 type:complete len:236 (+) Transcript_9299:48-755(+)
MERVPPRQIQTGDEIQFTIELSRPDLAVGSQESALFTLPVVLNLEAVVDSVLRRGDVAQAEVELSTPAIAAQTNQEEGLGLSREAPILFGDFLGMFIGPRGEAVVEDVAPPPEDVWIEYDDGEGGDLVDPLVLEGPVNEWPLALAYSFPVILIDEVLKFVDALEAGDEGDSRNRNAEQDQILGALEVGVDALEAGDEGDAPNSAASEGDVLWHTITAVLSPIRFFGQTITNLLEP